MISKTVNNLARILKSLSVGRKDEKTNKINVKVVFVSLLVLCGCIPTIAQADSVNLSENWYVKITDFSLSGGGDVPSPFGVYLTGFSSFYGFGGSTTSLIESKLQYPDSSNSYYSTLLFDFHAGEATTDDMALFYPCATVGSIWGGTMSFNWQIYCTNPRVLFTVDSNGFISEENEVWWNAPTVPGYRSGSASFGVGTIQGTPPSFRISFVPEPQSFVALLIPTSIMGLRLTPWRRRKSEMKRIPCSYHGSNDSIRKGGIGMVTVIVHKMARFVQNTEVRKEVKK